MDSEVNELKLRDECGINANPLHKPTTEELVTAERNAREFVRRSEQLRREREQELADVLKEAGRIQEHNDHEVSDSQRTV